MVDLTEQVKIRALENLNQLTKKEIDVPAYLELTHKLLTDFNEEYSKREAAHKTAIELLIEVVPLLGDLVREGGAIEKEESTYHDIKNFLISVGINYVIEAEENK